MYNTKKCKNDRIYSTRAYPGNMLHIERLELTLECPCVTAVFRHVLVPSFPFSLYLC